MPANTCIGVLMCVNITAGIVRYIEQQHQQWSMNQRSVSPNHQGGGPNDLKHVAKCAKSSPQDPSHETLPLITPNALSVVSVIKLCNHFRNHFMQNTGHAFQLVNLFTHLCCYRIVPRHLLTRLCWSTN